MSNYIYPFTDLQSVQILWRKHALQRMLERSISRAEVKEAIIKGTIIEAYLEDSPYPSCLIAFIDTHKPLHVVVAHDKDANSLYVITAYEPDAIHFEEDLMTRRTHG